MADISDIETALVKLIGGVLYPSGDPTIDGIKSPVTGAAARIYRGFPLASQFEKDVANGSSHVGVYPEHGMTRDTTRYAPVWQQLSVKAPTVTAVVAGLTVTFAGTAAAGHVVGVQFGTGSLLTGKAYRYTTASTGTTAAAGLASLIPGASSSGAVLTLPSSAKTDPELFGSVAADYHFASAHLTPGIGGGVQLPSTFRSEFTDGGVPAQRVIVIRQQGDESILPYNKDRTAIFQARVALRWDISEMFAVIAWVQLIRDNNGTLVVRDPTEGTASLRVFQSPNRLGMATSVQARF